MRCREATTEVCALMGRTWGGRRGREPGTARRGQGRFGAEQIWSGAEVPGRSRRCLWGTAPEQNHGTVKGKRKRHIENKQNPLR